MKRFVKGCLISVSLCFIGISSVSGVSNSDLAPFPVPLDCYVEDQNSIQFIEKNCNRVKGIENFKDPDVKIIKDSGHTLMTENPNQVLDYLIEALWVI